MSRWDRRPAPCLDFLSLWSLEVAHLARLEVVQLDPDTEGDVGEVGGGRVEEGGAGGGHVPKLAAGIGILTDIRLRWYRYNYVLMQLFGPRSCSNPTSGKWAHEGKILEGGGRGGVGGTALVEPFPGTSPYLSINEYLDAWSWPFLFSFPEKKIVLRL